MTIFQDLVTEIKQHQAFAHSKPDRTPTWTKVPARYTWEDIVTELVCPAPELQDAVLLKTMVAALQLSPGRLEAGPDDVGHRASVEAALVVAIKPTSWEQPDDHDTLRRTAAVEALAALPDGPTSAAGLAVMAAMTGSRTHSYPWTTTRIAAAAERVLAPHFKQSRESCVHLIIDLLLRGFVRPALQMPAITATGLPVTGAGLDGPIVTTAGRRVEYKDPAAGHGVYLPDVDTQVGKQRRPVHCAAVFEWAVRHSDGEMVVVEWALYARATAQLIQDSAVDAPVGERVTVLRALAALAAHCCPGRPPSPLPAQHSLSSLSSSRAAGRLLRTSGMGAVFADLLKPALLSLPPLTPPTDAARILRASFASAIALTRARFPVDENSIAPGVGVDRRAAVAAATMAKTRYLDHLLRDVILDGFATAHKYPAPATVILLAARDLVLELGVFAAKYLAKTPVQFCETPTNVSNRLQELLSMYRYVLRQSSSLSSPAGFPATQAALVSLDTLLSVLGTLIANSAAHRAATIDMLVFSWSMLQFHAPTWMSHCRRDLDDLALAHRRVARSLARACYRAGSLSLLGELCPFMDDSEAAVPGLSGLLDLVIDHDTGLEVNWALQQEAGAEDVIKQADKAKK